MDEGRYSIEYFTFYCLKNAKNDTTSEQRAEKILLRRDDWETFGIWLTWGIFQGKAALLKVMTKAGKSLDVGNFLTGLRIAPRF